MLFSALRFGKSYVTCVVHRRALMSQWDGQTLVSEPSDPAGAEDLLFFDRSGVIAMPTWRVPLLAFEWMHFVDYLSFHIPEEDQYFLDTLAFIFALEAMARVHDGGRVEQALWRLPWQLNAQLNWPKYDMIRNGWVERNSSQYPIVFLQYAQESIRFDDRGRFAQYDSETVACFPFLEQVNTKIQALYT